MSNATSLVIPGAEFGGGGLVGFMVGYGLKKITRLLLIVFSALVAIVAVVLAVFQSTGIITVNYAIATSYLTQAENYVISTVTWLYTSVGGIVGGMTQALPGLAGIGLGFTLGVAKG